jgi:hypothetical protein
MRLHVFTCRFDPEVFEDFFEREWEWTLHDRPGVKVRDWGR